MTYPAAQRHVDAFVEAGILRPLDDSTYDRVFIAWDILNAIHADGEE